MINSNGQLIGKTTKKVRNVFFLCRSASDFKKAILSYREMYEDDFDYEEEYALLNDVLSDILR